MTGTYVALLRSVNVGGTSSLLTKDLVQLLEKLGAKNVRTYIQSGNAVFRATRAQAAVLPGKIRAGISRKLGFAPEVILLRLDDLESAIAANPYPEADTEPGVGAPHLPRLGAEGPGPGGAREAAQGQRAPDGVGKSKLFARIERSLGVAGTARNWRSACKLLEMAREISD